VKGREIMLKTALVLAMALAGIVVADGGAEAATGVRGSVRSNGRYVMPHFRSNAGGGLSNNYSTRGNVNPFNGKAGTRSPLPRNGRR